VPIPCLMWCSCAYGFQVTFGDCRVLVWVANLSWGCRCVLVDVSFSVTSTGDEVFCNKINNVIYWEQEKMNLFREMDATAPICCIQCCVSCTLCLVAAVSHFGGFRVHLVITLWWRWCGLTSLSCGGVALCCI